MSALCLEHVDKRYAPHARSLFPLFSRPKGEGFYALKDISFSLAPGESLGIAGKNGAGKSTLLKIVSGVLFPSSGKISVKGRLATLLELGTGFHPALSGRENVYLYGACQGLGKKATSRLLPEIVEFSGLGDFIDAPVGTYSSGMLVRLGFAAATAVEPEILVIDEALSVGDGAFAKKSFDRIMAFKEKGVTLLFCSHALYQIEAICRRALWLEKGEVAALGEAGEVLARYREALESETDRGDGFLDDAPGNHDAPKAAEITKVEVEIDGEKSPPWVAHSRKSEVAITVFFRAAAHLPVPRVGVGIHTAEGRLVSGAAASGEKDIFFDGEYGAAKVVFPRLPLLQGHYRFDIYLACERFIHLYDEARAALVLKVKQEDLFPGLVAIPHRWLPAEELACLDAKA